jgi:hypothetical protein
MRMCAPEAKGSGQACSIPVAVVFAWLARRASNAGFLATFPTFASLADNETKARASFLARDGERHCQAFPWIETFNVVAFSDLRLLATTIAITECRGANATCYLDVRVLRETAVAEFWEPNIEMAEVPEILDHACTIAESSLMLCALSVIQA